jgi:hypothetical protein
MKPHFHGLLFFVAIAFAGQYAWAGGDIVDSETAAQFHAWASLDVPGGTVSIVQDGNLLAARGFGSAKPR